MGAHLGPFSLRGKVVNRSSRDLLVCFCDAEAPNTPAPNEYLTFRLRPGHESKVDDAGGNDLDYVRAEDPAVVIGRRGSERRANAWYKVRSVTVVVTDAADGGLDLEESNPAYAEAARLRQLQQTRSRTDFFTTQQLLAIYNVSPTYFAKGETAFTSPIPGFAPAPSDPGTSAPPRLPTGVLPRLPTGFLPKLPTGVLPGPPKAGQGTTVPMASKSLSMIAEELWGDVLLWPLLWDANKQALPNPNVAKELMLNVPNIANLSAAKRAETRKRGLNWKNPH